MARTRGGAGKPTLSAAPVAEAKSPVPGVVSLHPFVYRLKPRWGDTDIARIVYTGRIPDYGLMAIEAWAEARLGKNMLDVGDSIVALLAREAGIFEVDLLNRAIQRAGMVNQ